VRAYAHDLQKLFLFLDQAGLSVGEFTPARAMEFFEWLRLQSTSRRALKVYTRVSDPDVVKDYRQAVGDHTR
jgi:hypothetical protein